MGKRTGIDDISIGQATDTTCVTGCTVILCPCGAMGDVAVFGAAAGTRQTDLLEPGNLVEHVHGMVRTGGSAFGLATAQTAAGLPVSFAPMLRTSCVSVPIHGSDRSIAYSTVPAQAHYL